MPERFEMTYTLSISTIAVLEFILIMLYFWAKSKHKKRIILNREQKEKTLNDERYEYEKQLLELNKKLESKDRIIEALKIKLANINN